MTHPRGGLGEWEAAEVTRSASHAARARSLRIRPTSAAVIARYSSPPADAPDSLEYAYHLLGDVAGRTVLDLGCGEGRDATLIAYRGARVCAMDISLDLLRVARERAAADGHQDAVTFRCGSTHAIPLPDRSVDVVFGNVILHHVDLARTAREVSRVLRPGGRAIFREPIRDSRALSIIRSCVPYRHAHVSPFERPLRWNEVTEFAAALGTLRYRRFELPPVRLLRVLSASEALRKAALASDRALLRRFRMLERYATIVVFEVRTQEPRSAL
jgi:SAM-dependent methyltransferase